MKTIEKVIKNKSLLICGKRRNYSWLETLVQNHIGRPVYSVDNLNDKSIIELLQEITPLIYHLISRLKKQRRKFIKRINYRIRIPTL